MRGNELAGNAYDLASVTSVTDATDAGGNCFADNEYTTSTPVDIEQALPCGAAAQGFTADIALFASLLGGEKAPAFDYRKVSLPDPPALASMPKAKTAKARPATREPSITVKVSALTIPTGS